MEAAIQAYVIVDRQNQFWNLTGFGPLGSDAVVFFCKAGAVREAWPARDGI